jgi:hypothetical protein
MFLNEFIYTERTALIDDTLKAIEGIDHCLFRITFDLTLVIWGCLLPCGSESSVSSKNVD